MPPWRHSGLRTLPTCARPVPFCFHGFVPLPPTSARFLVVCVPRRSDAFVCTTDSQMSASFTRPPNTSSFSSSDPTFLLSVLTTSIFIAQPLSSAVLSSHDLSYFLPLGFSAWATLIRLAVIALRITT